MNETIYTNPAGEQFVEVSKLVTITHGRYAELIRYELMFKMLRKAQAENKFGIPVAVADLILGKPGSEVADAE